MILKLLTFLLFFPVIALAQNTRPLIATDNATQTCNATMMVFNPGSLICSGSIATVSGGGGSGSGPWGSSGSNVYLITSTNNVGIGTTIVPNKLYVAGTAEMQGFKMNAAAASGKVLTSNSVGIGTWSTAVSQTPWTSDINANGFNLTDVNNASFGFGDTQVGSTVDLEGGDLIMYGGGLRFSGNGQPDAVGQAARANIGYFGIDGYWPSLGFNSQYSSVLGHDTYIGTGTNNAYRILHSIGGDDNLHIYSAFSGTYGDGFNPYNDFRMTPSTIGFYGGNYPDGFFNIDTQNQVIQLGDFGNDFNSTLFTLNDNSQVINMNAPNGYTISGGQFTVNGVVFSSSGFVVNGGTSAQFLKANGSFDSNTYLTTDLWSLLGSNVYRNSGNVGIGTSLPGERLDIEGGNVGIGTVASGGNLDVGSGTICLGHSCKSSWPTGTVTSITAGTGLSGGAITTSGTINSNAVYQISFQPGLLTSVTSTKAVFGKVSKTSTVDNIEGSAFIFSCISNPTVTFFECGTSTTCASTPTTIGSVTITTAGTVVDGTVSNPSITAGDYVAWAITAGTCTSLDISATSQIHSN